MSVGDLNGDGRPDIAGSRPGGGNVAIFLREASGFAAPTFFNPDGGAGSSGTAALGDLDGDGILDLAAPNGTTANTVSIGIGAGAGAFTAASNEPVAGRPFQANITDLNRDGNADVVASADTSNSVSVLLANKPTVTVTPSVEFGILQPGTQTAGESTIGVTNNGPQRVRPGAVSLAGANPGDFTISSNTCTGASVPTGSACLIGVKFTPGAPGGRSASLSIPSNASGSPHVVALSGSGAQPPSPPPPPGLLPGRCANLKTGSARAQTLTGTAAGDRLLGLAGNDVLNGLAGDDCLVGGRGNDRLNGGKGKDALRGDAGNDTLTGGAGKNSYSGGAGKDRVNARNKVRETIDCGKGRDIATVDKRDKVKRNCERVKRR
jgi:Ca2+-binding RTX toxin-like protein